jgi:hypothetical protein
MDFLTIKKAVNTQFLKMLATGKVFTVDISRDELKVKYQASFPKGTNPIFRERAENDCNCCNTYIGIAGNAVAFIDGKIETIWNIDIADSTFQIVADAMKALVLSKPINSIFMHFDKNVGIGKNVDNYSDVLWNHYYTKLPAAFVKPIADHASLKGAANTNYAALKRSVTEITGHAVETVLSLIDSKSLYKGGEYVNRVQQLDHLKSTFDLINGNTSSQEEFLWVNSLNLGITSGFKSGPIGMMLMDLSGGMELEHAVNKYHEATAPENYKHSKKPTTKKMTDKAIARIIELGREDSLERRHAVTADITINDVLFADRSVTTTLGGVLGKLKPSAVTKEVKTDNAVGITIDDFLSTVVPKTTTMEVLVEAKHQANFMSLVAPLNAGCLPITEWDNNFSWSYNGELADSSMRKEVKSKGGNNDGVFGFSIMWNTPERLYKHDLDAHCESGKGEHIYHGNAKRIHPSSGMLDIDIQRPDGVAVENIVFTDLDRMPNTDYKLYVKNYSRSTNTKGFTAEVYFGGKTLYFDHTATMRGTEVAHVATVRKLGNELTLIKGTPVPETSVEVYGIKPKEFHKVTMVMNSPNFWDCVEKPTGNKHWFFILHKCSNPEPVRGLFNEHLLKELQPDRKVFEVLGNDLKAPFSEEQLSGLGFSISQTNSVVIKVRGELNRLYNVKFNK